MADAVTTLRSVLERLRGDSHKTYCVFGLHWAVELREFLW